MNGKRPSEGGAKSVTSLMPQIDSAKYLYLRSIHEPTDNVLLLIVQEAGGSGQPRDIQIGQTTISDAREIVSGESDLAYQIVFSDYISYAVTNESYTFVDSAEVRTGRLFSIYSQSHFLSFVRAATFATDDFPGPFTHYQVNCLNHSIDVVSTSEPEIKILESSLLDSQI
jgi:hypothetical protein